MAKLETMEKVVLEVLEQSIAARKDDYVLMYLVCDRLNPDVIFKPFGTVLYNHSAYKLPNWKTVERCRRKIFEKRPDLIAPDTAEKRHAEEEEYIDYSRT